MAGLTYSVAEFNTLCTLFKLESFVQKWVTTERGFYI